VGTDGASAALAGLVFVGISINLDKIVALRGIPEQGLEAIGLLFSVLVMSTLVLVLQPVLALGIELLAAAFGEAVGLGALSVAQGVGSTGDSMSTSWHTWRWARLP
jgi:hypothetical protein